MIESKYELKPMDKDEINYILEKLGALEDAIVPPREDSVEETIVLKMTNGEGTIIAGCLTTICTWDVADLDLLWVDERYRNRGLGSALIREAERIVREKGCHLMVLNTGDFQAEPVYEKHGYLLCGTVENNPRGHRWYSMMKYLDRDSETYVPSRPQTEPLPTIEPGSEEDADFISDKLIEYNDTYAPRGDEYDWAIKLIDKNGGFIAGCSASISWWGDATCRIWVEEAYRNQGIGSSLLLEFEQEAKKKGAYLVLANVNDWQTAFLKKNGYSVCSATPDYPKGHCYYTMQKRLLDE
jgi:GNAT superfamily N-acetyltransferase